MKFTRFYSLLVLLIICGGTAAAQVSGFDQVGSTSMQFLTAIPNARAAGMGGVGSALIQSSEATFFNPAQLVKAGKFDASVGYLNWLLDTQLSSVSLAYRAGNLGTFGFHGAVTDYGDIAETTVDLLAPDPVTGVYNPGLTGNMVTPSSMVFGLSFARSLTDRFAFGLTAKVAREDLVVEAVNAIMFDAGLVYETGLRSLSFGMMVRNFGAEVKFIDEGFPLPQIFAFGITGDLIGSEGDAFISSSPTNRLMLAYDLSQTRDHSQQQHVGLEYSFKNFVALRSGYKFNFDEESWTVGFGLMVNRFQLDYAYNDFGEFLENVQRFSLNFVIQ